MHDLLIIAGTAIVGGLSIDLQRRMPARQRIQAGIMMLMLGWIMMLGFSGIGPSPFYAAAAVGCALVLTAILLLVPAVTRTLRGRHGANSEGGA